MQVILLCDVKGVGKKGELVTVSDGYGRNFLLKKKMAQVANSVNTNVAKQAQIAKEFHKQEELNAYRELSEKIKGMNLVFPVKVGENGKLFGAVTSKEIGDKFKELGFDIDKRKIQIENIKMLGKFNAKINFAPQIESNFFVEVVSDKN